MVEQATADIREMPGLFIRDSDGAWWIELELFQVGWNRNPAVQLDQQLRSEGREIRRGKKIHRRSFGERFFGDNVCYVRCKPGEAGFMFERAVCFCIGRRRGQSDHIQYLYETLKAAPKKAVTA